MREVRVMPDDAAEFIRELTALSQKHGLVIKSCGCCGSPWLEYASEADKGSAYKYETPTQWGDIYWEQAGREIPGEG